MSNQEAKPIDLILPPWLEELIFNSAKAAVDDIGKEYFDKHRGAVLKFDIVNVEDNDSDTKITVDNMQFHILEEPYK